MRVLKLAHIIDRAPLTLFTKTSQTRLIHTTRPQSLHSTLLLTQRSVSLHRYSTQNDQGPFEPDGPATFFGIIVGLSYVYCTNLLINHFFENKETTK